MEERTIKVSYETAKEWYNSGGVLRKISLQAFTEEELECPSIQAIIDMLRCRENLTTTQRNQLAALKGRGNNISAPKLLRILAMYYNNGWQKEVGNTGFFLSKREFSSYGGVVNRIGDDWSIIKHESVNYPIPYFKTEADCRKAFLYLKRLGKLDALYSDL